MVRLVLAFAVLATPAIGAERNFIVTDFDRVRVEAPVTVQVTTGVASAARLTVGAASEAVDIVVEDHTAIIRLRDDTRLAGPLVVKLGTRQLREAQLLGDGTLSIDRLTGGDARLVVDGPGVLQVGQVALDRLDLAAGGAAKIELAGQVKQAGLALRGDGTLAAPGLSVADLTVENSGSGGISVTATRSASVAARGPGRITVYGTASCTITARGTGQITCRNPQLKMAKADPVPAVPVRGAGAGQPLFRP